MSLPLPDRGRLSLTHMKPPMLADAQARPRMPNLVATERVTVPSPAAITVIQQDNRDGSTRSDLLLRDVASLPERSYIPLLPLEPLE